MYIFQTLDLNTQVLETVAEVNGELLWISEMPDSNNWLIGTPNSIFRFDSRMENAKVLLTHTNGVKPAINGNMIIVAGENAAVPMSGDMNYGIKSYDIRYINKTPSIPFQYLPSKLEPKCLRQHPKSMY